MTRPAASRSLIRAHTLMDSEPSMTPERTGEARAALAAFPGIAGVTVIELDAGQCLIAYVVPSGPGLLPYQAPATPGQESCASCSPRY